MVKAFAARLKRIADRLDPPAKPANPNPFYVRGSWSGNTGTATTSWERPIT